MNHHHKFQMAQVANRDANKTRFTPDYLDLEMKDAVNLFVCDEMRPSLYQNWRLREYGECLMSAFTEDLFTLWIRKVGNLSKGFPIMSESYTGVPLCPIRGEIFSVKAHHIKELDLYKFNTVEYNRIRVTLNVPYRLKEDKDGVEALSEKKLAKERAWMYVASDKLKEMIDGGFLYSPVTRFKPNGTQYNNEDEYYYFTEKEFEKQGI